MNEQTTQLIEKLANKLGTTSEYLWGVLLKQAPVDAMINLSFVVFTMVYTIGWIFFLRFSIKKLNDPEFDSDEVIAGCLIGSGFLLLILAVISLTSMPDIISGFFNPEYWALNKILQDLK